MTPTRTALAPAPAPRQVAMHAGLTGVHLSAANAWYPQAKVTHTAHTLALPLAG